MDKEDLHFLLFLMLSHNPPENLDRTIHAKLGSKNIYLCARCTGVYSSMLVVFIAWFLGFDLPAWLYIPLFAVLPIPGAIDWITQSCNLRESRNLIRVITGSLFGVSQAIFLLIIVKGMLFVFLQALAVIGIYLLAVYIIARKTKFLGSRKFQMIT